MPTSPRHDGLPAVLAPLKTSTVEQARQRFRDGWQQRAPTVASTTAFRVRLRRRSPQRHLHFVVALRGALLWGLHELLPAVTHGFEERRLDGDRRRREAVSERHGTKKSTRPFTCRSGRTKPPSGAALWWQAKQSERCTCGAGGGAP